MYASKDYIIVEQSLDLLYESKGKAWNVIVESKEIINQLQIATGRKQSKRFVMPHVSSLCSWGHWAVSINCSSQSSYQNIHIIHAMRAICLLMVTCNKQGAHSRKESWETPHWKQEHPWSSLALTNLVLCEEEFFVSIHSTRHHLDHQLFHFLLGKQNR